MKNLQQPGRILWLVRWLTAIALLMVVATTGLIGWTLANVRRERARVTTEQTALDTTSRSLRERAGDSRSVLQTSLEEMETRGPGLSVVTNFTGLVEAQLAAGRGTAAELTLKELDRCGARLLQLLAHVELWRVSYLPVWADFRQERTTGEVRRLLAQLREQVDAREGRQRLDDALCYRQWRQSSGAEAARLAEEILLDQAQQQSRSSKDFRNQLAEFAQLVERLGGEEQFDNLADLKENQLKPALAQLRHAATVLGGDRVLPQEAAAQTMEKLGGVVLGETADGVTVDLTALPTGVDLFTLRHKALRLRREREHWKTELAGLFEKIEAANTSLAEATQLRITQLTHELEFGLARAWWQLLVFGGVCAGLFLWLARIISRGIHAQVNALDHACTAAEAGRQTTQKLMLEQQAAAAALATAHQGLQASEQRFRTLSAAAPIGIFLSDATGRALYFNPHWEQITGRAAVESLGDAWQRAVHPDDAAVMLAARTTAAQGETFDYEFRMRRPSGEERWVHACSVVTRSQFGEVTGHVGTVQDITERRRAEELLRLQEAALRSAANVVVITDRKGNIVWTNPAFTKVTGYTAEEVLGKNPRVLKGDVPVSPYPPTYYQTLWKTISSGTVWQGEFHNWRKDRTPLIEEATITPVRGEKGVITHFVAVKQDITERKRAEAELLQAQQALVLTSREAGMAEVATGVLHNVGNVLNSVNVSATLVADLTRKSKAVNLQRVVALLDQHAADLGSFFATDPKGAELPGYLHQLSEHLVRERQTVTTELDSLCKNIAHIKGIVAMQQSFAKVSGVSETVPVPELVEDALRMNAASLTRHTVAVRREFAALPVITVDKYKALQILVNLIRNAKQACEDSGRDEKQMTLRISEAGDRVRISVTDNGVGIPPENLTRIFSHGFTTKSDGHGFGLHSGALAAKEMGGTLRVHSEGVGHGATFTLELPQPTLNRHHDLELLNHS